MRLPNLNSLRMFDAAARHLNFRLAAEELHLTQGAVAQQVRRLESDLGCKLFHRQARGLALTEFGRAYCRPIRRALALIEDATEALATHSRRITISVPPSFAAKWLVPRLAEFAASHPDIDLQVMADEGLTVFRNDGVDLAIRQGGVPTTPGLAHEFLCPLALSVVANAKTAAALGTITGLHDLAGQSVVQDGHRLWEALSNAGQIPPPARLLQLNQTALAMDAARNGQGLALVPRLYLDGATGAGLVPLWRLPDTDDAGFYLVWPNRTLTEPADAVRNWLRVNVQGPSLG